MVWSVPADGHVLFGGDATDFCHGPESAGELYRPTLRKMQISLYESGWASRWTFSGSSTSEFDFFRATKPHTVDKIRAAVWILDSSEFNPSR